MLIRIDENTLEVTVTHSPADGFMPSEESIAINKYAELIRNQQKQFIEEKHNPLIRQLIKMVSDFNYKNDKTHAAQVDAMKAKIAAEEQAKAKPIEIPGLYAKRSNPVHLQKKNRKSTRKAR